MQIAPYFGLAVALAAFYFTRRQEAVLRNADRKVEEETTEVIAKQAEQDKINQYSLPIADNEEQALERAKDLLYLA